MNVNINQGLRPQPIGGPVPTAHQSQPPLVSSLQVAVPDAFLSFEFQKDRKKNVGSVGVEISILLLKRHIAYTTASACCYRTNRDVS